MDNKEDCAGYEIRKFCLCIEQQKCLCLSSHMQSKQMGQVQDAPNNRSMSTNQLSLLNMHMASYSRTYCNWRECSQPTICCTQSAAHSLRSHVVSKGETITLSIVAFFTFSPEESTSITRANNVCVICIILLVFNVF